MVPRQSAGCRFPLWKKNLALRETLLIRKLWLRSKRERIGQILSQELTWRHCMSYVPLSSMDPIGATRHRCVIGNINFKV